MNSYSDINVEIQNVRLTEEREKQILKPIEVVLIYRPPGGNSRLAREQIKSFIGSISELERKELIIMGDLNWDLLDRNGIGFRMVSDIKDEFRYHHLLILRLGLQRIKNLY